MSKFVLLSAARSGTSLVVETLNTHPEILVHGELFHEDVKTHIRPVFRDSHDISLRERDPLAFVDEVLGFAPGVKAVGFKIWQPQSPAACDHVLADVSTIKIILERKNRLAHFTSGQFARKTGIWNMPSQAKGKVSIPSEPVPFNPRAFGKFNEFHDSMFDHYRRRAKGPVIEMTYEQAARLQFAPIFSALGVTPMELQPKMMRLHSGEILSRFIPEDRMLVSEELARLGRSEWVREDV